MVMGRSGASGIVFRDLFEQRAGGAAGAAGFPERVAAMGGLQASQSARRRPVFPVRLCRSSRNAARQIVDVGERACASAMRLAGFRAQAAHVAQAQAQ